MQMYAQFHVFTSSHLTSLCYVTKLNRNVMMVLFFIPLTALALFETTLDTTTNRFMKNWFGATEDGEEDDPENQDPDVDEEGMVLSKVPFAELVKAFPNTQVVSFSQW